jgi:hypothetical protein
VNVLLSFEIGSALAVVAMFAMGELVLVRLRLARGGDSGSSLRLWRQLPEMTLRVAAVLSFVALAFPNFFGVRAAPSLVELLQESSWVPLAALSSALVTSLCLSRTALPRPHLALLVPVQGCAAIATLFAIYVSYLGARSAGVWPGVPFAVALAVMAGISHWLAVELGRELERRFGGPSGHFACALELPLQTPVLIYYAMALGRQIAM